MITWVLILFAGGMVLILAEFIVPGMICGILGGLLVLSSAGLGCYTYPDYTWTIILSELVGVFAAVVLGMFLLARTRAGKNLILSSSQQADAGWVAAESDASLVGAQGEVFTALRPAGTILIHGKRVDAVSDGTFIDKGATVRVIEVHGSRVVVEQV
jgi:membrane-bound serine protease (ClpP class)